MNMFLRVIEEPVAPAPETLPDRSCRDSSHTIRRGKRWNLHEFAEDQIRGLVQQLFVLGVPRPAKHAVFCPVATYDCASLCLKTAVALAIQVTGSVGLVAAARQSEQAPTVLSQSKTGRDDFPSLREFSEQVSTRLWHVPYELFATATEHQSADWLEIMLKNLHLEFDYTIVNGPPAGLDMEAALLGRLSDGVVLVLEANSTRRAAAQVAKQNLRRAEARLLGTVLVERTFPVPHAIYQRL
jgi:hypothetical protein